jgi:hypothetical protein
MNRAVERRIRRLEQAASNRVNQRYRTAGDLVANLNPVEREQRLLAIRERVADNPTVRARLDEALDEARRVAMPLSPESNALAPISLSPSSYPHLLDS